MKQEIRLTVDIENPAEVKAAIEMLRKFMDNTVSCTPAEKKTEKAKSKAEPDPPQAPAAEKKVETPSAIKIEDIRAMLAKKVDAHRPAIKTKFTELGSANVTSLKEENYDVFMNFLAAL